jgi:uncharacterized membrane protein YhaH (DUF805 family)
MSNPALKPWENFVSVLKNDYSNFSGRARRSDYWWFGLVFSGLGVLGVILSVVLGAVSEALGLIVLGLLGIAYIGVFIPAIAISIRRLHDINKSGWWLLISFVPFGSIVLLVFYFTDSDRTANKFGPSPKYDSPATVGSSAGGFNTNSGTLLQ